MRDYPCKYGHNNCAIKDGGNCFDEMELARERARAAADREAEKSGYYDDEQYRSEMQAAYSENQL